MLRASETFTKDLTSVQISAINSKYFSFYSHLKFTSTELDLLTRGSGHNIVPSAYSYVSAHGLDVST